MFHPVVLLPLLSALFSSAVDARPQGTEPDVVIPDYALSGPQVDSYYFTALMVQLLEHDDLDTLCVNHGDFLLRDWSDSRNGATAAISAHFVNDAAGGPGALCGPYGTWYLLFWDLFFDYDTATVDAGGVGKIHYTTSSGGATLYLKYAHDKGEINFRRDSRPDRDGPGPGSAHDQSYPGTPDVVAKALRLADFGFDDPHRSSAAARDLEAGDDDDDDSSSNNNNNNDSNSNNSNPSAIEARADVHCGSVTTRNRGSTKEAACTCQGKTYIVECNSRESSYQGWTKKVMNQALLTLVSNIGGNHPTVGEIITSAPNKGAVLCNGYVGSRNYNPKGDKRQADCCRSAIQQLAGTSGIPSVPADCNCHVDNTNWLLATGASFLTDKFHDEL